MKPHPRELAVAALSVTALFGSMGCVAAAAAAGAAGAIYVSGDLETTLDATPNVVAAAAVKGLSDLGMSDIESSASALDGEVTARSARDDSIKIVLEAQGEKQTDTSIRVGTFGDEEMSVRILDAIKKRL